MKYLHGLVIFILFLAMLTTMTSSRFIRRRPKTHETQSGGGYIPAFKPKKHHVKGAANTAKTTAKAGIFLIVLGVLAKALELYLQDLKIPEEFSGLEPAIRSFSSHIVNMAGLMEEGQKADSKSIQGNKWFTYTILVVFTIFSWIAHFIKK